MSGDPVILPPQMVQLHMWCPDQHGAYVPKVCSLLGVLANDYQYGLGKVVLHSLNFDAPIRGLFSRSVAGISQLLSKAIVVCPLFRPLTNSLPLFASPHSIPHGKSTDNHSLPSNREMAYGPAEHK